MATDWTPWKRRNERSEGPLLNLQGQVNRLFDDFFSPLGVFEPLAGVNAERASPFSPRIDVIESENQIIVTAELPGIDEKDVELTLNRESLTIRGEKRGESERKEGERGYFYERTYGSFQRVIPLSVEIAEDKVEASFNKGVLKIKLPKSEETKAQSKKISIKTGN